MTPTAAASAGFLYEESVQAATAMDSVRVAAPAFFWGMPGALAAGASGAGAATDLLHAPNSECMKEFFWSATMVLGGHWCGVESKCLGELSAVAATELHGEGTLAALLSVYFMTPLFVTVVLIHCTIPSMHVRVLAWTLVVWILVVETWVLGLVQVFVPDDEGHLCWLGHGDILVMDGQCQDEFLHRTDPGREQERIDVTFRRIKQHVSSCPLFKAGVACCLPTCAQGSSVPVMGVLGLGCFGLLASLLCLVCMGSAGLASPTAVHKTWVTLVCLLLDTPFGRRSVEALHL